MAKKLYRFDFFYGLFYSNSMIKTIKILFAGLFFILFAFQAFAREPVRLYFFYGDGCPHCAKEEKFFDRLEQKNKNIEIYKYEVWRNKENADKLALIADKLNVKVGGVPFLIIGDEAITGYYSDAITGAKIEAIIDKYIRDGCEDVVGPFIGLESETKECIHGCEADSECVHNCGCGADKRKSEIPKTIALPIFGEMAVKDFSLPALTILIGALDGFNPCAMWTLIFLISLLLGMKNKKRMWILGSAFIAASGMVYFLFLAAWLNLFLYLGFVFWIRTTIALVALASGGYHLWDAWRNRGGGCHVTADPKRKKIFNKLRQAATQKQFWLALLGIIVLAAAVNLVELVCSAGLPAVYTQILALSNLPAWQYYSYLILYIFVFMLDDMIIFFVAMITLQMKTISSKYSRYSSLAGGVIMLIIGLLLLFKPGWLMFG